MRGDATSDTMFAALALLILAPAEPLQDAEILAAERAQARAWLADRNLLDRVPAYVRGTSDDSMTARRFEKLCGRHARGAFDRRDVHVFSEQWLTRKFDPTEPDQLEAFTCLLSVAQFTGFEIGFVGNGPPENEAKK